jgi:acyl-CoA oxidase
MLSERVGEVKVSRDDPEDPVSTAFPDELRPLVPFIVAMWDDGRGTDVEIAALRRAGAAAGLSTEASEALASWTEPSAPPTPNELAALRSFLRTVPLDDEQAALASLTTLGIALRAPTSDGPWSDSGAVSALDRAETELGLIGGETARRLRGIGPGAAAGPDAAPTALSASLLNRHLERDHSELRVRVLGLLEADELRPRQGLPYEEYREHVLEALRFLAGEGLGALAYPVEHGGAGDPGASIAVFETLAYGDLSVLVKFGVQFGLFGGSILQLGTARHHERYLPSIGRLELPGCYAMTETGHGSNVRDLETIARFDPEARELVLDSPTEAAGKDWIGNAARHGRIAVVFARLEVAGEDHGVHAVVVPIRDEAGRPLPGVRIEDRGLKVGLNGVDNGRIWFDDVRVPVENLLDRFATIDEVGTYRSPIPSPGRRFFTMLGTLVAGRVSIATASVSATKLGLTIAVRYAAGRRQFGPGAGDERPILGYTSMQRTLMPALATTYGLHFAVRDLQARFDAWARSSQPGATPTSASDDVALADDGTLEVRAAGLKAWASDHCSATLAACREACGGQGYLAANRLGALKADTDIFTTFEGANAVLYQLAAKGLLSAFRDEMGDLDLRGALRWIGERAETTLTETNPVVTRRTDTDHLLDPDFHRSALQYRQARLLRSVARRIRARLRRGVDSFDAVNEVQDHLIALARANVELDVFDAFRDGVEDAPAEVRLELDRLCALYALSRIEVDRGWYLESGYLEPNKARAIRTLVGSLCAEAAAHGPSLVDAFGIPEFLLPDLVRD